MTQHIDWIQSDGGPLICILASVAHGWRGIDGASAGSEDSGKTDYERACSISGYLGSLIVKDRTAIILGDMPMVTSIVKSKSGLYILRIMYADSENDVIEYVSQYDGRQGVLESEESQKFESDGSGIVIFDSAYPGAQEKLETISYPLARGLYRIDARLIEIQNQASFILHEIKIS